MTSEQQQAYLKATAWLQPWTRFAATFACRTQGFLPSFLGHLPLRLIKRILALYLRRMNAGSCSAN